MKFQYRKSSNWPPAQGRGERCTQGVAERGRASYMVGLEICKIPEYESQKMCRFCHRDGLAILSRNLIYFVFTENPS